MTKKLIFVEHKEHKEHIDKAVEILQESDRHRLIAFNSKVMFELERRGIPFKIPYDYYPLEELASLNENLYEKVERISLYLNDNLFGNIPFFAPWRDKPAFAFFHPMKCAFNNLCHRALNIRKVLEKEKPDEVVLFLVPLLSIDGQYLNPERTGLYPQLSKMISEDSGIRVKCHSVSTVKCADEKYLQQMKAGLKIIYNFLKKFYSQYHSLGKGSYPESFKKTLPKILAFTSGHSVSILADQLKLHSPSSIVNFDRYPYEEKPEDQKSLELWLQKGWERLKKDNHFKDLFDFNSFSLFPLMEQYLAVLFQKGLYKVICAYEKAKYVISEEKVDMLLLSTITFPESWAIAMACQQKNIPIVTWQHGSYAMFDPHTQPIHYDIKNADYFFVFGEGVRNAYLEEGRKYATEIIPVGCSPLDALKVRLAKRNRPVLKLRKTVLFPLRGLDVSVLGDSYQIYPPDMYWRELRSLLKLFSKFLSVQFVLKLYPGNTLGGNPIRSFLKYYGIRNVIVKERPRFSKLLKSADLVLIDWPYTTLLEALQSDIPTICYEKFWRLRLGVGALLEKCCHIARDPQEIEFLLQQFIDAKLPTLDNHELLHQYGTFSNDGKSLNRATAALQNIAHSSITAEIGMSRAT